MIRVMLFLSARNANFSVPVIRGIVYNRLK